MKIRTMAAVAVIMCVVSGLQAETGHNNTRRNYNAQLAVSAKSAARDAAVATVARSNSIAKAVADCKWKAEHPWVADPKWHEATNRLAVIGRVVERNERELRALSDAGVSQGDRVEQVRQWNYKATDARHKVAAEVSRIENEWRLKAFYTNPASGVAGGGK